MHYPVLIDMDNGYALSLNLAIWVGAEVQELMAASGRDLPRYQGNDTWMLPLPASFVVDTEGIVRARFIDPDYRKRMAIEDLLQAVQEARISATPSALVVVVLAPHRAYPSPSSSAIENPGVKRNNSASLRIGGHFAAARTRGACR